MSNVYAQAQQPSGGPQPINPLPSRDAICTQQISTVLMIMRELQPYLLAGETRDIDTGQHLELDGGAACAALTTFVKACDRLDHMLNDMSRWNLKEHDGLYSAMTDHFNTASEVNRNQIEAVKRIQSPAVRLKPQLTTIGNEFIAFLVTSDLPGGTIIGKGRTPQLALDDFNAAFTRLVEDQLRFAAASEERLKAAPAPIEEKKKRKKRNGY